MMKNKIFNGARLKSARLYRGKTIIELAKESKIDVLSVERFENNNISPNIEETIRICAVLNFQREYFFEEDDITVDVESSFFKTPVENYYKEELKAIEKAKMAFKILNFIERYISFPKLNIIHEKLENSNMECIAYKLRNHYKLGNSSAVNLLNLLEVNGFVIIGGNIKKSSTDSFTIKQKIYEESRYFMGVGNDKKSLAKRNYDLAKQLGHVVLHDKYINRETLSSKEFQKLEEEAREFAACFLLDKETFLEDLKEPSNLEYYAMLKREYIVPIELMLYRAYQLQIISYRKYEHMIKEMKSLGWDKKEPFDNIKATSPILFKKGLEILEENKIISLDRFSNILSNEGLSLKNEDIEELIGLKKGALVSKKKDGIVKNDNIKILSFDR